MRLRESFLLTFFVQGIVLSSGFLNGIIIARTIGKVGRGEYAMIYFMVSVFLVIFGEGLYRSNIYLTSRDKSEKNINLLSSNILLYNGIVIIIFILFALLPHKIYSIAFAGIFINSVFISLEEYFVLWTLFGVGTAFYQLAIKGKIQEHEAS